MKHLPRTVDELIDTIDDAFPLRKHSVDTPIATIQREYGTRDVVDYLRRLQKEREEDITEDLLANALDNE